MQTFNNFCFIAAATLAAVLPACGGSDNPPPASAGGAGGTGTVTGSGGASTVGGSGTGGGSTTGGTNSTGGAGGAVVSLPDPVPECLTEGAPDPAMYLLLDDLEDGDASFSAGGIEGSWSTVYDSSLNALQNPNPFLPFQSASGCANAYSAFVQGAGLAMWGSALTLEFQGAAVGAGGGTGTGTRSGVDLSAYTGVSFWVRTALPLTADRAKVAFSMPTVDTDPDGGICSQPGAGVEPMDYCYDHFTAPLAISSDWKKVEIKFSSLKQGGWGRKAASLALNNVFSFRFDFTMSPEQSTKYDLWVDNVALMK